MKQPKRIGLSLFDDELKALINASAKIFPMSQEDVNVNLNPNGYEYVKVDRSIYIWHNNAWEYVIADDVDIDWTDINNKPINYTPDAHTHTDLHTHINKGVIDSITQLMIDTWNGITTHISDVVKHITSGERTLWNTVSNKANTFDVNISLDGKSDTTHNHNTVYSLLGHGHDYASTVHNHDSMYYTELEVDSALLNKASSVHNHDGAYYKQTDVNTLLGGKAALLHNHTEANITDLDKYTQLEVDNILLTKSNTNHGHIDLHAHVNKVILDKFIETVPNLEYDISDLKYIADIRAGYTEGHAHSNLTLLETITQGMFDLWDSAVTHISDAIKHITSAERILWNTVSGKETSFSKNTAFNKNFGSMVGTVTQGNDVRLSDSRIPITHNHDTLYYTEAEVTSYLSGKSETTHLHDGRYYTEVETDGKLASKVEVNTFIGHTGNTTVHVTQINKDDIGLNSLNRHTHTNKVTIDKFTEVSGKPYYDGAEIGGAVPNLTLTELTLGNYKIVFNAVENSLDFEVI